MITCDQFPDSLLDKHAEEVAESSFPPPGDGTNELLGQEFQIGSLPLLNTLLLQNSPRQLAADRVFVLTRYADAADSFVVSEGEQVIDQTVSDRTPMEAVFAQLDW
jgi:hypothetical protein